MDIRNLSVGDWVNIDDPLQSGAGQIVEIRSNIVLVQVPSCVVGARLESIEPIPITPEILEKNGWSKKYDDVWEEGVWRIKQINKCLFVLYYENSDYDFCVYVDTVHQLQHALRLAGVEKEIVL